MDENQEKLAHLVQKYLAADTDRKNSTIKGQITKTCNQIKSNEKIWAVLNQFIDLPTWFHERFKVGSLYIENSQAWGWYCADQCQAEPIPLELKPEGVFVNFYGYRKDYGMWKDRGFEEAESMPIVNYGDWSEVRFPIEKTIEMAKCKYALACELQWKRKTSPSGETELVVTRSILSEGFWQAWKWSPSSRWWYLKNRPELFKDEPWWEKRKKYEPVNDPYAMVLGGTNDEED